jgi:D-glycero-D-manno-heptose 1,7-bisphosphate phosphatase
MRPTLFLDRDGIVNVDRHHVFRIEDITFVEGIFELTALAHAAGLPIVIVTNQAGIARGKYTEDDFYVLMEWMGKIFAEKGTPLTAVYFCPSHPDFPNEARDRRYAGWRKPEAGMFLAAAREHSLDLGHSYLVGDRISDAQAGLAAGLRRILIVNPTLEPNAIDQRVDFCQNLQEAILWLQRQIGTPSFRGS